MTTTVNINGYNFRHVPDEHKSRQLCERAVAYDGMVLAYMPKNIQSPEICETAVKTNGNALLYVLDKYKSFEVCDYAVTNTPRAIEFTPLQFKDQLIQKHGLIQQLPMEFRTKELCEKAFARDVLEIEHIPPQHISESMASKVVYKDGMYLRFVPVPLRLDYICKYACQTSKSHKVMDFIPPEYKTYEYWRFIRCPEKFASIPIQFQNEDMWEDAFDTLGIYGSFQYMPDQYKTYKRCLIASCYEDMFQYIPDKHKTKEVCMHALRFSKWRIRETIRYFPPQFLYVTVANGAYQTYKTCTNLVEDRDEIVKLVEENPAVISVLNLDETYTKVFENAVKQDSQCIDYVPVITYTMCLNAFVNAFKVRSIPLCFITRELYEKVLAVDSGSLVRIPEEDRDYELYFKAFKPPSPNAKINRIKYNQNIDKELTQYVSKDDTNNVCGYIPLLST